MKEIETSGLTLFGVFGIKDVLRPGVIEAVKQCNNAGIYVKMVTGDNQITAEAIAINAGIIKGADLPDYKPELHVMLGKEFMDRIGGVVCKLC